MYNKYKGHYKIIGEYAFFYGGCFSQWYPSKITDSKITFSCAEQRMMYKKALLFNDAAAATKILKTPHPDEQKSIGRKVKNFNVEIWNKEARKIVYDSNWLKFTQNLDLQKILLSTKNLLLVEASPTDNIWGIKRGLNYKHLDDKKTWKGLNWLGLELTRVKVEIFKTLMWG